MFLVLSTMHSNFSVQGVSNSFSSFSWRSLKSCEMISIVLNKTWTYKIRSSKGINMWYIILQSHTFYCKYLTTIWHVSYKLDPQTPNASSFPSKFERMNPKKSFLLKSQKPCCIYICYHWRCRHFIFRFHVAKRWPIHVPRIVILSDKVTQCCPQRNERWGRSIGTTLNIPCNK